MVCPKCGLYMDGELSAVDSWAAGTVGLLNDRRMCWYV